MPPERGSPPDIDRLLERIRAEARERFPEDVRAEAAPEVDHRGNAGGGPRAGGISSWRARLRRHPVVGRAGRLVKGLALAGRTRVQAVEAGQAAQAALRDVTQLKTRLAAIEGQTADVPSLVERLGDLEGRIADLERTLSAELTPRIARAEETATGGAERAGRAEETAARAEAQSTSAEDRAARAERGLRVARADVRARDAALDRLYAVLDGRADVAAPAPAPAEPGVSQAEMDAFFSAFDVGLRGPASALAEQLCAYLPDIRSVDAGTADRPVLDLGCGRGTWLRILRDDGVVARGIDLNRALVAEAQADGLDVRAEDALAALRACGDATLGAITAFHLAEHLPFATLYAVVAEARRTLVPGGLLLAETPNPENGYVGTHTFYHDPTHANPLTPALLHFIADYHGFADIEIRRVHPYPVSARLPDGVPANDRLNGWLCGPQDFALVARTAGASAA